MVVGLTTTCAINVYHPVHHEVYSIQHYVIKFVSNLHQVGGFPMSTPVSSTNKTDCHDIIEILLKVASNTLTNFLEIYKGTYNTIINLETIMDFLQGQYVIYGPVRIILTEDEVLY